MQREGLDVKIISSLAKVFADEELRVSEWTKGSMLANEVYAFQVAYRWKDMMLKNVSVQVNSELSPWITLRKAELIPSEMPCYHDHDDNILRTTPGLYPDLLQEFPKEGLTLLPGQWRTIWVTINPQAEVKAGIYSIEIVLQKQEGEELAKKQFDIEVIDGNLPKQSLIHTEWFHADCLATWYDVEVFSEKHWSLVNEFLKTAVSHGINMILTPIFSPPLDTAIGGERPTVQLVDVQKEFDNYSFSFDKLDRWIALCQNNGVEYFEFAHLFTQWGAKHAPKIMATENSQAKQIFGWETDASGESYQNFLDQFLPALIEFIKSRGLEQSCYFHISDEPRLEHLDFYKNASNIVNKHLQDFPVIDALSNYDFYENGLVKNPIPATNHIEDFLDHQVPDLWAYYCCSQYKNVSNRFFNMPSARNRIIGLQLYKYNITGFLHWGYNFWYSQYSIYSINPYCETDGGYWVPSGDPFLVYPGEKGPLESIRLEVFYEALQDLRACKLLEKFTSRETVLNILEEGLEKPITFSEYPTDANWLLDIRKKINAKIAEFV